MFFGRITEIKGLPYIIKAWYDLYLKYGDNIPPLWIVGGTPNAISNMRDRFLRDIPIDKLESSLKLCWWGYLTPASISALLLKTSVVIMHSRYEAGGLVVIEALASGTPVIATDAGFAHDLVRDWENGFLVPYADVDCLKKRMEHFVIQPLLSRCLGITAQKVYHNAEEFWQSNQTQMEVYNSLWNGNQPISVSIDNRIFFSTSSFQHCILNPLSEDITIANKEKICALLGYSSSDAMSIDISYQKNLSHHSEVWIMNNKNNYYIIKKLYSLLNCDIFWENESIDYGISAIQRIKKNLLSAQSKYIVRIINYNLIDNLYAMEKYENITTINNVSLPQIVHLINDFNHDMLKYLNDFIELESKFNIQNTLPHTGEHIFFSAISKNDYSQKNFFNQLRAEIGVLKKCIHIAKSSELEIPLSIQYGKSFNGHIVSNRKYFLLLPSETIYYGESGLDIARLLIDMWIEKTFMESEIMNDFDICSLESGNSLQRLYLLASIILIVRLKMKFVFDVNPNIKKESKLLSFLTNKLSEIYLHDNM